AKPIVGVCEAPMPPRMRAIVSTPVQPDARRRSGGATAVFRQELPSVVGAAAQNTTKLWGARCGGIDRQCHVRAENRLESLDGASFIATAGASAGQSADANGTDQLSINYDRQASGVGEESVLGNLPRKAARIVLQLRCADGGGLARFQRRLSLQQCRADIVVDLPVHAFHVHQLA